MTELLREIAAGTARLDPRHPENGMVSGRRGSTPAHRQAPVNLNALSLTDRRTGVVAILSRWANRIRSERHLPVPSGRVVEVQGQRWVVVEPATIEGETAVLAEHWSWALQQPWGPEMVARLEELRDQLANGGRQVKVRVCPVCSLPVRLDRLVADHRECLMSDG